MKIGVAGLATAVALLGAAGGAQARPTSAGSAPVHLGAGATRLHVMLAEARVPVGRGKSPAARSFPAAWRTFQRFARIPVDRPGPSGEGSDDLLFEFGVFESNFYGTSFEVELTRQFATAGGDLEQVHLVVHLPVTAFIAITRSLRAMPCVPGDRCLFRCFFADDDALVPHPCRVVPRGTGGYRVGDMTIRASQADGGGVSAQRTHWIEGVESSPVFRALLSRHVRPDGYEVWQEPAE